MKSAELFLALVAGGQAAGAAARAPRDNIAKLKQIQVSGTDLTIPPVPQQGRNADAIRARLKRVRLPPGFRIELFAVVPDARHMAVAPSTNMVFVGTRKTTVWAVADDGRLYIALCQPHKVPPAAKADGYSPPGISGIVRMKTDGAGREVFARGIRNSVGMDFNPKDKSLCFTGNQTNGLGGGPAFRLPVRERPLPGGGFGRRARLEGPEGQALTDAEIDDLSAWHASLQMELRARK